MTGLCSDYERAPGEHMPDSCKAAAEPEKLVGEPGVNRHPRSADSDPSDAVRNLGSSQVLLII